MAAALLLFGVSVSYVKSQNLTEVVYFLTAIGTSDIYSTISTLAPPLRAEQGKHPTFVFTYGGKPIKQANTKAWKAALRKVGIENFRWHDLRHSWASWLVQNGTPLYALQEMGAAMSAEMVRRYAHLAPANFRQHACVVDQVLNGTNTAQCK